MDEYNTLFDSDLAEYEYMMSKEAKDENKVAPCPFCKNPVTIKIYGYGVVGAVNCSECKTMFLIPWDEAATSKELTEAWNARNAGMYHDRP